MPSALGVVVTTDIPVEGRAAIPAYVDDSLPIVGPARAVQVITDGRLAGGPPIPVRLAPPGTPAIGPALPIYLVAGTLLDPLAYTNRVKATSGGDLLAYWTLADASGNTATDESGNGRNGTYSNVTLGQQGVGDGRSSASFNGTSSFINMYSAALAAAFNGSEGTIALWVRVASISVWTDATQRWMAGFTADANNRVLINKQVTDRRLVFFYAAGGTSKSITIDNISSTNWIHIAITWSKAADQLKAYIGGVQVGATQTGLGNWAGSLSATASVVGASTTVPAMVWNGNIQHVALWRRSLSAGTIASLVVI